MPLLLLMPLLFVVALRLLRLSLPSACCTKYGQRQSIQLMLRAASLKAAVHVER
jgi:hypothetical protein